MIMTGYGRRSLLCSRGGGLLEVLVALLIASIGILGLAAAHLGSLRAAHEAQRQVTAVDMAATWLELVREYPALSAAYPSADIGRGGPVQPLPDPNCPESCAPDVNLQREMQRFTDWLNGVHMSEDQRDNPGEMGPVACLRLSGNSEQITLVWRGLSPQKTLENPGCGPDGAGLYDAPGYPPGNRRLQRVLRVSTWLGGAGV